MNVPQTNQLEEHAYREQLANEDEARGTPAPMPWWLIALIFTLVCALAGWVAA